VVEVLRSEAEATAMPYLTVYCMVTSDGYYQRNDNDLLSLISSQKLMAQPLSTNKNKTVRDPQRHRDWFVWKVMVHVRVSRVNTL